MATTQTSPLTSKSGKHAKHKDILQFYWSDPFQITSITIDTPGADDLTTTALPITSVSNKGEWEADIRVDAEPSAGDSWTYEVQFALVHPTGGARHHRDLDGPPPNTVIVDGPTKTSPTP